MKKNALMPVWSVLGALLLAIVVGVFSASPFSEGEVAHAQSLPTLAAMTLSGITDPTPSLMTPTALDTNPAGGITTSYTARVQTDLESTTVTAAGTAGAMVDQITATGGQSIASGSAITLAVGTTTISIPVTQGAQTRTYTVRVTRVPVSASDDTKLSSLSLSNVTLSPTFDSSKRRYTDRVPHNTSLTTVTARVSAGAEVDIKYVTDSSFDNLLDADGDLADDEGAAANTAFYGQDREDPDAAGVVALAGGSDDNTVGTTTIAIRVRAADVSSVHYYIVTVTRAAENANSNSKLALVETTDNNDDTDNGLALQTTDDTAVTINLSPAYSPDKTAYTASVAYTVRDVTVHANPAPGVPPAALTTSVGTAKVTSNKDDDVETTATAHMVALEVGANVITIKVDAANAIATRTYTVTVTRASATASADANLSSLSLTGVTLSPEFDPGKTDYDATVQHNTNLTTVTASAADSGAIVRIIEADSSNVVELAEGAGDNDDGTTTITITVTAADGVTDKNYEVTVTRVAKDANSNSKLAPVDADADATNNGLALQTTDDTAVTINLSPAYSPDKAAYTASVAYNVRDVTVHANPAPGVPPAALTTSVGTAKVTSNKDDDVDSDGTAHMVALEVGANVITIKVDAANAIATRTYTVTVTRASATASADANLSSLSLTGVTLSPEFDPGKMDYDATVPNATDSTRVIYTAMGDGATVQITLPTLDAPEMNEATKGAANNINLGVGTNVIDINVMAANGIVEKTYKVTIDRAAFNASDNARLAAATFRLATVARPDSGNPIPPADADNPDLYLNMPFASTRTDYTTTADRNQKDITLVAVQEQEDARVMVTSNRDDEVVQFDNTGDDATPTAYIVELKPGINVITIKVTAENAVTMQTYTVTVTRTGSGDPSLHSLSLSGITLEPAFAPGTAEYMSAETLDTDVTMTTVTAVANHGGASVAISSDRDDDIGDDNVVDLHSGRNVITVMVTAEDGTNQTYTVTVTVAMGDTLLDSYDANDNGRIDKSEALTAIEDYIFRGILTKDQALEVIALYIFG